VGVWFGKDRHGDGTIYEAEEYVYGRPDGGKEERREARN
jgi:hypothetical protein